ncbi:hypothetical protein CF326_g2636 [Tilletia indica]|nr:hypothetical protein CF326_g2636 [Tilletia indica]
MSSSISSQQQHTDKVVQVFKGLKLQNLGFGRFVQGVLNSKNSDIKSTVTKWLKLSNRIENIIDQEESSARRYGPEDVLDAIVAQVNDRGDEAGIKRFNEALMKHARPLMVQEVDQLCDNDNQWLRVPSTNIEECAQLHQSLSPLAQLYRQKLPSLFRLFSMLINKTDHTGPEDGEGDGEGDGDGEGGIPAVLNDVDRVVLPLMSSILFARNRLLNRFQMIVGVLLAVSDTPDMVKGFLHHCGLAVSQPTIRATLESISDRAAPSARRLFEDKKRIKVFLFDNINIYMRRSQIRITDFNTAAALTMRTIYTLPSSFLGSDLTQDHIQALREADRTLVTTDDSVPDPEFLERAGIIHIAEHLIQVAQLQPRQHSAVSRRIQELKEAHAVDVLDPEATTFVSLKLLREDEGTLDGIQAVLTETMKEMGINDGGSMNPLLVAGDLLSVRNTLAVQDAGRFEDESSVHRLDNVWPVSGPWHMLQSWLYLIFKTHFSPSKAGKDGCLDRLREVLRRGRTALREDKPLFNEGWEFGSEVWKGRLQAMLDQDRNVDPTRPNDPWAPDTKSFFRMCVRLYKSYFTAHATERAREAGDEVHAVVCSFMRDWLIGMELAAATKEGDIGRMKSVERFMCLGFMGGGQHNYAHLILDRRLADCVLPEQTSRCLRAAQLINRRGEAGDFEAADHYQETLNKEIQAADTSRASHHVLDRLEDRLSAIAEQARLMKEAVTTAWKVPHYHRTRTSKAAELDILQIKRVTIDTHLFNVVSGRTTNSPPRDTPAASARKEKETAKAVAKRDAEHGKKPFKFADPLMRGYVKLKKGALEKWQGRNSGMEIRQLLLETLAEDDEEDYDALTSGVDDGRAAAAGSRVVQKYRRGRDVVRMEELWEEATAEHEE